MTDTKWADTSRWQVPVNNSYPHQFFCFKCSDGGDIDPNNAANLKWSKANAGSGKQMVGFAGYHVYRVGEDNLGGVKRALGSPNEFMAIMLDVEDWEGEITTDQSGPLNKLREQLIDWLGGSRSRVFGYANTGNGNMQTLWPNHDDTKFVIPNYSGKPSHPDMIAHQYADDVNCAPFGPCDANIAYGKSPSQWAQTLGIGSTPAEDDMPTQIYLTASASKPTKLTEPGKWYTMAWDGWSPSGASSGSSTVLADATKLFQTSAWLYTNGLTLGDNLYWRIQTLNRACEELAKFPIGEIRGTTGDTDIQFTMLGSVNSKTNLRILVSATAPCTVKQAWWRTLQW
jgi:hypothetical protein